jgi:hypothetical protein
LPILTHVVLTIGKRLSANAGWLRKTYIYSGGVLVVLAGFLLSNGAMDRSPVAPIRASILHKSITSGRYSTTHHLIVSSWRPGTHAENLMVDRDTYLSMMIGERVVVEVHRGFFGLTWYGRVTPDR